MPPNFPAHLPANKFCFVNNTADHSCSYFVLMNDKYRARLLDGITFSFGTAMPQASPIELQDSCHSLMAEKTETLKLSDRYLMSEMGTKRK